MTFKFVSYLNSNFMIFNDGTKIHTNTSISSLLVIVYDWNFARER